MEKGRNNRDKERKGWLRGGGGGGMGLLLLSTSVTLPAEICP